ncbi:MAG: hypothetical protein Ct9H300mP21_02110 [Pseudomonadota bacterium]|nr:MAG: hypothetical protein Ct9H300mP21_02110 [Pseudomonadota bacterium]
MIVSHNLRISGLHQSAPHGRLGASINNVSTRWHCDYTGDGVPKSYWKNFIWRTWKRGPQDVFRLGELVGGLTPRAAEHLGLTPDLPVVQGGADAKSA